MDIFTFNLRTKSLLALVLACLVALESKYSLEGNISGLFYHGFLF